MSYSFSRFTESWSEEIFQPVRTPPPPNLYPSTFQDNQYDRSPANREGRIEDMGTYVACVSHVSIILKFVICGEHLRFRSQRVCSCLSCSCGRAIPAAEGVSGGSFFCFVSHMYGLACGDFIHPTAGQSDWTCVGQVQRQPHVYKHRSLAKMYGLFRPQNTPRAVNLTLCPPPSKHNKSYVLISCGSIFIMFCDTCLF